MERSSPRTSASRASRLPLTGGRWSRATSQGWDRGRILARLLHNLKRIYLERSDDVRLWWVVDRLLMLEPGQREELRDRGLIAARLGAAAAAAKDLTAYLDVAADSPDAPQVREVLETVRSRNPLMN